MALSNIQNYFRHERSDHFWFNQITLQTKGTPLPITLGKIQEKERVFTQEDSRQLQNERHFTDNDMR